MVKVHGAVKGHKADLDTIVGSQFLHRVTNGLHRSLHEACDKGNQKKRARLQKWPRDVWWKCRAERQRQGQGQREIEVKDLWQQTTRTRPGQIRTQEAAGAAPCSLRWPRIHTSRSAARGAPGCPCACLSGLQGSNTPRALRYTKGREIGK